VPSRENNLTTREGLISVARHFWERAGSYADATLIADLAHDRNGVEWVGNVTFSEEDSEHEFPTRADKARQEPDGANLRIQLATHRAELASERTLLEWVRTAIFLIATEALVEDPASSMRTSTGCKPHA
jgi:Domain of unknown function (DUF202)